MALKAYAVTEMVHREAGKLVFAESATEAKTLAFKDEIFANIDYTDLRATRAKFADNHEQATEQELLVLCVRNGWVITTKDAEYITKENVDEALRKGWL